MSVITPGEARYYVLFKDDYSDYTVINFMKEKSGVPELLRKCVQRIEIETGNAVNTFRSDGGGEYIGTEIEEWVKRRGIRHEKSPSRTLEQNGVSQRNNRTVVESA